MRHTEGPKQKKGLSVSDEVRCAKSGYMIPILATDNKLRKKEWVIEFEGPASFLACRHYIHTHTHAYIHTYIQRSRECDKKCAIELEGALRSPTLVA